MKIGWIVKQKHIVNQSEIEKKKFAQGNKQGDRV